MLTVSFLYNISIMALINKAMEKVWDTNYSLIIEKCCKKEIPVKPPELQCLKIVGNKKVQQSHLHMP